MYGKLSRVVSILSLNVGEFVYAIFCLYEPLQAKCVFQVCADSGGSDQTVQTANNHWMDTIALDKVLFSTKKFLYFSYYWMKTYIVGTH